MPEYDQNGYIVLVAEGEQSGPDSRALSYEEAVKRNRRKWSEWRTQMNCHLVESLANGTPMADLVPLKKYLGGSATNNPKTLLAYAETPDNSTTLHRKTFLNFGIPRVKLQTGRVAEAAEPDYERLRHNSYERLRHNDVRSDGDADRQRSSSSGRTSSSDRSDSASHSSSSRSLTSSCSSGHLPGRIRMT